MGKKLIMLSGLMIAVFLAFAPIAIAQSYRYEYDFGYSRAATSQEAAVMGGTVLLFYCCILFIFLILYVISGVLVNKIYVKNGMTGKLIFAFIPFISTYYLAKAVGEEKDAMVYALSPFFAIIPCLGIFIAFYFTIKLWMKVSFRMTQSEVMGIAYVLAPIIPFMGSIISLFILILIANGHPIPTGVNTTTAPTTVPAEVHESHTQVVAENPSSTQEVTNEVSDSQSDSTEVK